MNVYIISDTHFSHANIIKYCNRPFESVEQMNRVLIDRWNAVVTPDDTVIHLGDVFWSYRDACELTWRLNGRKMLVRGNHDWDVLRMRELGFGCVTTGKLDYWVESFHGRSIMCAHSPRAIPTWKEKENDHNGASIVRLCGHEHNNAPIFIRWVRDKRDVARPVMAMNMSCEYWDYKPARIEDVIACYDRLFEEATRKLK